MIEGEHSAPAPVSAPSRPLSRGDEAAFKSVLGELLRLRGWRLRRVADRVEENIDRELAEGSASPRDEAARALVERKHLRALADALAARGLFAADPCPADLLAIRYADRPAFESYGRLHARLVAGTSSGLEASTLREMLLALRLRMLCLDWPTIALVFEALRHPCTEVSLRKRQSRLAVLARADVAGAEDWARIDGYLKARKRSFGGSARRSRWTVILVLLVTLSAAGALALAWVLRARSRAPLPIRGTVPATEPTQPGTPMPTQVPEQPPIPDGDETKAPPTPEKGGAATPGSAAGLVPWDDSLFPLLEKPAPGRAGPWTMIAAVPGGGVAVQHGQNREVRIEASALVQASIAAVESVLEDPSRVPAYFPHVSASAEIGTEQHRTRIQLDYEWPGEIRAQELLWVPLSHSRRDTIGLLGDLRPANADDSLEDSITWRLQAAPANQTRVQFERVVWDPEPVSNEAEQVIQAIAQDTAALVTGLGKEAERLEATELR